MTCLVGSERGLINAKVLCAAGHQPSPYTKSITEMSVRLLSSPSLSLLPFASKVLGCRRQRAAACLFPAGEESSGEESGSGCEFQQCSTEFEFNATEVTGNSNKSDKKVNTSAAPSSGLSQAALFLSILVLAMQRQWR